MPKKKSFSNPFCFKQKLNDIFSPFLKKYVCDSKLCDYVRGYVYAWNAYTSFTICLDKLCPRCLRVVREWRSQSDVFSAALCEARDDREQGNRSRAPAWSSCCHFFVFFFFLNPKITTCLFRRKKNNTWMLLQCYNIALFSKFKCVNTSEELSAARKSCSTRHILAAAESPGAFIHLFFFSPPPQPPNSVYCVWKFVGALGTGNWGGKSSD